MSKTTNTKATVRTIHKVGDVLRLGRSHVTGATTAVEKSGKGHPHEQEDGYVAFCLSHGEYTHTTNAAQARRFGAHPESFCESCKPIAAGKAEKVAERVAV